MATSMADCELCGAHVPHRPAGSFIRDGIRIHRMQCTSCNEIWESEGLRDEPESDEEE